MGKPEAGGSLKPSAFCGRCQCQHVRRLTVQCSNSLMRSTAQVSSTKMPLMQELHGKDTQEVLLYLSQRNPITPENFLRNIASGVTAPPHVTVHVSKSIVKHIMASMEGNPVASCIFRKKDKAVTMDTKSTIKIQDEYVHVDPQLLFQRLLTVGSRMASYRMASITKYVNIPQHCLSQLMQIDQPQNPVWQMLCGVLKNFLDHLKQFHMS